MGLFKLFLLTSWISTGSIDAPFFDDQGLLSKLEQTSPHENGYEVIHYLNDFDYQIIEGDNGFLKLKALASGKDWDQDFVRNILDENAGLISDLKEVLQRPQFKFPDYDSVMSIPTYQGFMGASYLMTIKSRSEAWEGDLKEAITSLDVALKFSEAVKTEENATLISYMIGLAMQYESVNWLHQLLSLDALNQSELSRLKSAMEAIASYQDDDFEKVFYGEYKFVLIISEEERNKSFSQRWEDHQLVTDDWESAAWPQALANTVFPSFYFHTNEFLTDIAPAFSDLAGQTSHFCNDLHFVDDQRSTSLLDIIKPNSLAKDWLMVGTEQNREYFYRRCLSHNYFDAVRTIIAIQLYERAHGKKPKTLQQLPPEFLTKLPVDYFDGGTLKYSKEKNWLYSVGANFENNGGAFEGAYRGKCMTDEACYLNPTIPITLTDD